MTARPLIGITTYLEDASWGAWRGVSAALIPAGYVRAVDEAGGRPLLLPPAPAGRDCAEYARDVLAALDGLVVAGGADLAAARYGAVPHPGAQPSQPWRDDHELALTAAAVEADLPLLGVCRGMQVMAVAAGGSLHQHLPDLVGHVAHSPAPATYGQHGVDVRAGTLLYRLVGDHLEVHSYHHQAVAHAPGYVVSATAPDGTIEAMESPIARFRLGVQWHPEVADTWPLFEGLVSAAGRR